MRFGELDVRRDLELLDPAPRFGENDLARGGECLGGRLDVVGSPERLDAGEKGEVRLGWKELAE